MDSTAVISRATAPYRKGEGIQLYDNNAFCIYIVGL